ncbi:DgyrCDS6367 [Dimorphilus gyrociliatus]|uniref:Phosphopantothenoylcysteine decarboxylase n=1 Tax=Dimorphilus gyrociliatus TaxID=2664684 RepID=A0A7I8VSM3_9ANNE|nr:DgyrCDS6367 [Dimorphilus gyrociliatus]
MESDPSQKHILVAFTGSVATIKAEELVEKLLEIGNTEVQVICTERSKHFVNTDRIRVPVFDDNLEWTTWKNRGDPVLHIELRKWADLLLIAPIDANTLAKISNGLSDNLVTCVARAWDFTKPFLFAPAMNTAMWKHPITSVHVNTLKSWGFQEIPVTCKKLMCGDTGAGAMASIDDIVKIVRERLFN